MNEAANDSARVSGQDRKKPSALGTNQIAGFGGFHPLASLEKKINKRKKKKGKKHASCKHDFALKLPCVKESGFRDLGNFCLWNPNPWLRNTEFS